MPKVIYDKINGDTLLYTNMHLQLVDQSLCYPKGILEDIIVRVGQSYVPIDFVVLETGGDVRAPIILGRPFLSTTKAIIYMDNPKICFTIKDRKEKFTFKNRMHHSPSHPQMVYLLEESSNKKEKQPKKEEQGQAIARRISQDDQHTHIRV